MKQNFTKSDLKTGMIATTRNGDKYLVLTNFASEYSCGDCLLDISKPTNWHRLSSYDESLKRVDSGEKEHDIIKIDLIQHCYGVRPDLNPSYTKIEVIWKRKENIPEYTMEEAIAKMGYEFKIKK